MSQGSATESPAEARPYRADMILPTHREAYISHQSNSLKDCLLMFPSHDDSKEIIVLVVRDDSIAQETRVLTGHLQESDTQDVLGGFCQRVALDYTATGSYLLTAYLLARPLFRAYDGGKVFPQELLSQGMLGVQERDWHQGNTELRPLRDDFRRRRQTWTLTPQPIAHFDPNIQQQYLCMGDRDEVIVVMDKLKEFQWKYRVHSFDVGLPTKNFSFQMFIQQDEEEVEDLARMAPLVCRIFAEAREHVKTRSDRPEEVLLREEIRRADFYRNSIVRDDIIASTQPITDFATNDEQGNEKGDEQGSATRFTADAENFDAPSQREFSPTDDSISSTTPSNLNETKTDTTTSDSHTQQPSMSKRKNRSKKTRNKKNKGTQSGQEAGNGESQTQTVSSSTDGPSDLTNPQETTASSSTTADHAAQTLEFEPAHERNVSSSTDDLSEVTVPEDTSPASSSTIIQDSQALAGPLAADSTTSDLVSEASQDSDKTIKPPPPKPFKFDSNDPRLRCNKPDCRKMTNCWDTEVVICPACRTNSYVRYCSKGHLYEDIQRHWLEDCRKHVIEGPIDRKTIRRGQHIKRPYIPGCGHNLVERHRQAVYRALEDADFFLFDDAGLFEGGSKPSQEEWSIKRGTGKCVLSIVFPDDGSMASRRLQFDHHVELCLMFGTPLCYASCVAAMSLLRESLVLGANWTEKVLDCLCLQLAGEWGGFRVPEAFYNVNDVNVLWHAHRIPPPL
ncbi:hypothetical protein PV11_07894 [Exophiala sideris]|uniref:Uncharacterized protein n=1 Tax=Exophiala sideris TaxID=1016849 RepID=A0A0D1Z098_9EURO|nr:hypothetical protein PV11_07894 [Exophiala sideris]